MGIGLLNVEVSRSHPDTLTLGRTPLERGPVRRRDLYLTTHNSQETSMPPEGFEPAVPASERAHSHALHCAATGIGHLRLSE